MHSASLVYVIESMLWLIAVALSAFIVCKCESAVALFRNGAAMAIPVTTIIVRAIITSVFSVFIFSCFLH